MKNQTTLLALLIGLHLVVSPGALGANQLGYGVTRCSLYNDMHTTNSNLSAAVDSWTLGYLSGLNQAAVRSGAKDVIGGKQPDRVLAFVRGYCLSNADSTINEAADNYWYDYVSR